MTRTRPLAGAVSPSTHDDFDLLTREMAASLARAIEAATAFLGRPLSDAEIRKVAGAVARHHLGAPPVAARGLN